MRSDEAVIGFDEIELGSGDFELCVGGYTLK